MKRTGEKYVTGAGTAGCVCAILVAALVGASLPAAMARGSVEALLPPVLEGTLQVVAVHSEDPHRHVDHDDAHFILLKTSKNETKQLVFPATPPVMPASGTYVLVRTQSLMKCPQPPSSISYGLVCVQSVMALEAAPVDSFEYGQPRGPITFHPVVFILQVCAHPAPTTPEALEQVLFSDVPGARQSTVQGMMSACSYNQATFARRNTHVVRDIIPVPCAGRTPAGVSFSSSACPFIDWSEYVLDYAQRNLQLDVSKFTHRIFVVPSGGDPCGWGGMGYVGCGSDCRTWINGQLWSEPAAYMHELGHNLYLKHAGVPAGDQQEYGDLSGAMGLCCDLRCYNTPHLHQLGWAAPVATLYKGNFPAGTWQAYTLPASISAARHFLRVRPDWNKLGKKTDLWVSFRKTQGYDAGLRAYEGFGDRVVVYSTPAGDTQPHTLMEKGLVQRERWLEQRLHSWLVLRVRSIADGLAVVAACRKSEASESSCSDGLDNDCDGRIDDEDPNCVAVASS